MDHYGIRGIPNKWFECYLFERKQYVSVTGVNSDTEKKCVGGSTGVHFGTLAVYFVYK